MKAKGPTSNRLSEGSRSRSRSRIVYLNTSNRKAHALPPSCPDCYADLFRAPLHEVLPKPSPSLHAAATVRNPRYGFPIIREYRLYLPPTKCHPFPAWDRLDFHHIIQIAVGSPNKVALPAAGLRPAIQAITLIRIQGKAQQMSY